MKKAILALMIGMIVTSCSNANDEIFNPSTNAESVYKYAAKGSDEEGEVSLEEAIRATLQDDNLVAINRHTLRSVYHGELLPLIKDENNPDLNAQARTKVVCSSSSGGHTTSIVHVYLPGYSGYQLVTSDGHGNSASSEMGPFAIFSCPSVWSLGWR